MLEDLARLVTEHTWIAQVFLLMLRHGGCPLRRQGSARPFRQADGEDA